MQQLHNLSTLKLNLILSEKIEIRRQLNEISWLESFLQFQQDLVSPSEYLKSWARHKFFKDEILKRPEIEFQSVLPDLKLHGSLIIVADHEK